MTKDIREQIKKVLEASPYGMTMGEIAAALSVHRYTATKYIYELIGRETIFCKDVGKAKLCFLSEKERAKLKGQVSFSLMLLFIMLMAMARIFYGIRG